eukprot:230864-Alexandrium_andersonii.AAC.1
MCIRDSFGRLQLCLARSRVVVCQLAETCETASGVRSLNCAALKTTPNSTPEGPVRGVRRHFAR